VHTDPGKSLKIIEYI